MSSLTILKLETILNRLNLDPDDYDTFVETGTYLGETIKNIFKYFSKIFTIEISEKYYNKFLNDFSEYENIEAYLGDSSKVLEILLDKINTNTIFWLDGHWSSGDTGRGDKDCPLIEELTLIDQKYKLNKSILLIDDYSLFGTNSNENWLDITEDNLLNCFKRYKVCKKIVIDNIYVLYIESK